jgi:fibronectin-binding autotransporter adhesin
MADYWALSAGNWSNVSNWLTGTTPGQRAGALPGPLDDVYANNRTVVIDINPSVNSIRTTAGTIAAAGGSFIINNGVTLSAGFILPGTTTCLSFISGAPNSCTIIGNATGSSTNSNTFAIRNTNSGTVNILGNVTGGSATQDGIAVRNETTGVINLTGTVTGGTGGSTASDTTGSIGISNAGSGQVTIVGDVSGGSVTAANGVANLSSGNIFIRGTLMGCLAGSTCGAVYIANNSTGTINVTGNVLPRVADVGNIGTITNNSTVGATVNVVGNIIGGLNCAITLGGTFTNTNIRGNIIGSQISTTRAALFGSASTGTENISITGNVIGGGIGATAIEHSRPGTLTVFGNVSADFGRGITNALSGTVNVFGNVIGGNNTNIYGIHNSTTGIVNVFGSAIGGPGSGAHGVWNNQNNGTVYVARAVGNDWGLFSFGIPPLTYGAANGLWNQALSGRCYVGEINCGSRGMFPVGGVGPIWLSGNKNTKAGYATGTGGRVTMIINNPDPPFGFLHIPRPSQVANGTPVDNTLGTATFENPETIWNVSLYDPNLDRFDDGLATVESFDWSFGNRVRQVATLNTLSSVAVSLNNQRR